MPWLSWLTDFVQAVPLNSVLREQKALAEQKSKQFESENTSLKERVAALTAENAELKRRVEQAPVAAAPPLEQPEMHFGCYIFDGDRSKMYCPKCYETEGKKHLTTFEQGVGWRCVVCEKVSGRF